MSVSRLYKYGLLSILLSISTYTFSQDFSALKDNECYVVLGAFNLEKNAVAFSNSIVPLGYDAQYKYNSDRSLYYVYSFSSKDRESAKKKLFSIRDKHSDMSDSWLYAGNFKGPHITSEEWASMLAGPEKAVIEEAVDNTESVAEKEVVEEPVKEEKAALETGAFRVYLNTVKATNQREISADFKVIDLEREKQLSPIKSHEEVIIKPKNGTNRIKLVSNIFGYKIEELVLDLDEPLIDTDSRVEVKDNTIFIDFELSKYKKGEFAVLWQVFFYRDAAIMKEESVYELNQLLGMMRDDDKMRIKIHGHTNGNSHGKVLHLDLDDKQFFSLNGSHNEDIASAKKLSEYRAYTIQHWLMDQGIAENRMEIVGWGGKKMLQDKHDDKAHQNVRVEIEVLETS